MPAVRRQNAYPGFQNPVQPVGSLPQVFFCAAANLAEKFVQVLISSNAFFPAEAMDKGPDFLKFPQCRSNTLQAERIFPEKGIGWIGGAGKVVFAEQVNYPGIIAAC